MGYLTIWLCVCQALEVPVATARDRRRLRSSRMAPRPGTSLRTGLAGRNGAHRSGHLLNAAALRPGFRFRDLQCGVGNGRTIAWTAHDDEFSSRDRSLAGGRAACTSKESPMSSSMVNFIAIIVRRSGATSLKPCLLLLPTRVITSLPRTAR